MWGGGDVMDIVVGHKLGGLSSNPGRSCLHFYIARIALGEARIQLFSFQLWVNNKAFWNL